ncbi:MAG: pyridoxal phosphate-dependent aminotransferase [Bacteroidia bacterium]|nr:pyridoxal phosphate-dependent aminotransferase [Bacteroidia bacterium]
MIKTSEIYRGASRLVGIEESQTLAITKKVRELQGKGIDVVGLTLGEPDFDTPDHVRVAGIQAIHDGLTHYPPVAGIPELRDAIVNKFKTDNKISWKRENIVVSTGAKQALVNVFMSLVNPGDEVILFAPYWVSYLAMIHMAGGIPVIIETTIDSGYQASAAQLEAHITDKTRLIVFNSPSNPTGSMYPEQKIREIGEVIARYPQVFMVSDEIYEEISYEEVHFSPGSIAEIAERVITVNGVSKGFAMTGWRIGYLGAAKWIADLCDKYQGQITSGASTISQWASVAALNGPKEPSREMVSQFLKRRNFMYTQLGQIEGLKINIPEGAFYFYPDFSGFFGKTSPKGKKINNIDDLCEFLIDEAHVAVVPGTAFGTRHHVRISYAYSQEQLTKGCQRIVESLATLK